MYNWLKSFSQDLETPLELAVTPATEAELADVEATLQITLPPSYRAFLQKWNGGTIESISLLSTAELLTMARTESGFIPFDGTFRYTYQAFGDPQGYFDTPTIVSSYGDNPPYTPIYAMKPAHFLGFARSDGYLDLYCFDTSQQVRGEWAVCFFDHEDSPDQAIATHFSSFAAFLLQQCYDLVEEGYCEPEREGYWINFFTEKLQQYS